MIYRAKLLGAVVVKLSEHVAGYANLPEPLTEIDVGIIFSGSTPPVVTAVRRKSAIS